jgi:hypothetical protein
MPNFDEGMVIRFLVLATKFVRGIKGESGNIRQIATTPAREDASGGAVDGEPI